MCTQSIDVLTAIHIYWLDCQYLAIKDLQMEMAHNINAISRWEGHWSTTFGCPRCGCPFEISLDAAASSGKAFTSIVYNNIVKTTLERTYFVQICAMCDRNIIWDMPLSVLKDIMKRSSIK